MSSYHAISCHALWLRKRSKPCRNPGQCHSLPLILHMPSSRGVLLAHAGVLLSGLVLTQLQLWTMLPAHLVCGCLGSTCSC